MTGDRSIVMRAVRAAVTGMLATLALGPSTAVAGAQQLVTVHGYAYDGLRATPLAGALIAVIGTGKTTISDRRGRWEVDSIAPGTYTFTMNHDALDSLGLAAVSSRVQVTDGRADVRLSVPSFGTFWQAGCARSAPRDSMLVYGSVRHAADQTPVKNAKVELAWLDLGTKGRRQVTEQQQTLSTTTDSTGAYGLCGVPKGAGLRIRASTDGAASGVIDLLASTTRSGSGL